MVNSVTLVYVLGASSAVEQRPASVGHIPTKTSKLRSPFFLPPPPPPLFFLFFIPTNLKGRPDTGNVTTCMTVTTVAVCCVFAGTVRHAVPRVVDRSSHDLTLIQWGVGREGRKRRGSVCGVGEKTEAWGRGEGEKRQRKGEEETEKGEEETQKGEEETQGEEETEKGEEEREGGGRDREGGGRDREGGRKRQRRVEGETEGEGIKRQSRRRRKRHRREGRDTEGEGRDTEGGRKRHRNVREETQKGKEETQKGKEETNKRVEGGGQGKRVWRVWGGGGRKRQRSV